MSEMVPMSLSNDRPTKKFLASYYHDDAWWLIEIDAYDHDDAEQRVKKLGNLRLDGELVMTIRGAGWLARSIVAVRNFFFPG